MIFNKFLLTNMSVYVQYDTRGPLLESQLSCYKSYSTRNATDESVAD